MSYLLKLVKVHKMFTLSLTGCNLNILEYHQHKIKLIKACIIWYNNLTHLLLSATEVFQNNTTGSEMAWFISL